MYVVGRYAFDRTAAVRILLWTILTLAAYSAAVSILQFHRPDRLGLASLHRRWVVGARRDLGRPGRRRLQPAGRQRNAAGARLRGRDVADEPVQRGAGLAEVVRIRDCRRLRLWPLSDPHQSSLAQRSGRAHHRCTAGKGIPHRVHRGHGHRRDDHRNQLVGVYQQ